MIAALTVNSKWIHDIDTLASEYICYAENYLENPQKQQDNSHLFFCDLQLLCVFHLLGYHLTWEAIELLETSQKTPPDFSCLE